MAKLDSHIEKLTQQLASLKEAKVEKMNGKKFRALISCSSLRGVLNIIIFLKFARFEKTE